MTFFSEVPFIFRQVMVFFVAPVVVCVEVPTALLVELGVPKAVTALEVPPLLLATTDTPFEAVAFTPLKEHAGVLEVTV